jgi:hypothetical protein
VQLRAPAAHPQPSPAPLPQLCLPPPSTPPTSAVRLGYDVLVVDSDVIFFHNPYAFLQSPLLRWALAGQVGWLAWAP